MKGEDNIHLWRYLWGIRNKCFIGCCEELSWFRGCRFSFNDIGKVSNTRHGFYLVGPVLSPMRCWWPLPRYACPDCTSVVLLSVLPQGCGNSTGQMKHRTRDCIYPTPTSDARLVGSTDTCWWGERMGNSAWVRISTGWGWHRGFLTLRLWDTGPCQEMWWVEWVQSPWHPGTHLRQ